MTTFKYTDPSHNALLVEWGTSCVAVYMHGTDHNAPVYIPDADVPTVAAAFLNAAGWTDLAGHIEADIDVRERAAERKAAEKKLQERRDALAKKFSDGRHVYSELVGPTPRKAIDAYIALEDGTSCD